MFQHANLTAKCPDVPRFEGVTSDDLADSDMEVVALYRECAKRHNDLVDSLKAVQ